MINFPPRTKPINDSSDEYVSDSYDYVIDGTDDYFDTEDAKENKEWEDILNSLDGDDLNMLFDPTWK